MSIKRDLISVKRDLISEREVYIDKDVYGFRVNGFRVRPRVRTF